MVHSCAQESQTRAEMITPRLMPEIPHQNAGQLNGEGSVLTSLKIRQIDNSSLSPFMRGLTVLATCFQPCREAEKKSALV